MNRIKFATCAGLAVFLLTGNSLGYDEVKEAEPEVELIGISVARATDAKGLRSVWAGPYVSDDGGTGLTFNVHANGHHFIGLDTEATTVAAFTDDCGTDLNPAEFKGERQRDPFSDFTYPEHCYVSAFFPGRPHKDATKLRLDATLALVCGKELVVKQQAVELAEGNEITCGPFPLKIDSLRTEEFNGANYIVELVSKEARDAIRNIEFLDANDKVIEHHVVNYSFAVENKTKATTCDTYHGFESKPEVAAVRISFYKELETILVPVKLETGLGL